MGIRIKSNFIRVWVGFELLYFCLGSQSKRHHYIYIETIQKGVFCIYHAVYSIILGLLK